MKRIINSILISEDMELYLMLDLDWDLKEWSCLLVELRILEMPFHFLEFPENAIVEIIIIMIDTF